MNYTAEKVPEYLSARLDEMYRRYITPGDQLLVDTVFAPHPTQEKLDECLRVCDIEVMGAHKTLLLSYLKKDHPELDFGAYAGPRIEGLINFFRFANMKVLTFFCRIGKALNAAGIPILVIKGGAMRIMRPELPRVMADVDFVVPAGRFDEAAAIGETIGRRPPSGAAGYAVDIVSNDGTASVDIHRRIRVLSGDTHSYNEILFARAREYEIFGIRVLLPAPEDLFFIMLSNLQINLSGVSSLHSLFFSLVDCRFLLAREGFNWNIVCTTVRDLKAPFQIRFAAEFINRLVPDLIPDINRRFPLSNSLGRKIIRKMENRYRYSIFDREFFEKRRDVCRRILVIELKRHPKRYGMMMLKLFLLGKLRVFPSFIRWYLNKHYYGKVCDAC